VEHVLGLQLREAGGRREGVQILFVAVLVGADLLLKLP
jgi:hypothetical protein